VLTAEIKTLVTPEIPPPPPHTHTHTHTHTHHHHHTTPHHTPHATRHKHANTSVRSSPRTCTTTTAPPPTRAHTLATHVRYVAMYFDRILPSQKPTSEEQVEPLLKALSGAKQVMTSELAAEAGEAASGAVGLDVGGAEASNTKGGKPTVGKNAAREGQPRTHARVCRKHARSCTVSAWVYRQFGI
jgi:hypothetical protein